MLHRFVRSIRHLNKVSSDSGATLTELLIAGVFTITVVGAAGASIAAMVGDTQRVEEQEERRLELNRSVGFILNEINQSDEIVEDASSAALPSGFTNYPSDLDVSTITPVLILKKAGRSDIVYYTATPTGNTWRGPQVVYRFGPSIDETTGQANTANAWEHQPLIDKIDDDVVANFSCELSWTPNNNTGFRVCVSPDGSQAQIFHTGALQHTSSGSYETSIQAATRASEVQFNTFSPNNGLSANGGIGKTTDGYITLNQPGEVTVSFLGGDIRSCGGCTPQNTLQTVYYQEPGQSWQSQSFYRDNGTGQVVLSGLEQDTKIYITAQSSYTTKNSSNSAHSDFVKTVLDGEAIPNAEAAWGGGTSLDTFLNGYIDNNNVAQLPNAGYDSLMLFELYTASSGSTYDLQDAVLYVHLTPDSQTTSSTNSCDQGIGNGAEGCDPGNSNHINSSNDEGSFNRGGQSAPIRQP